MSRMGQYVLSLLCAGILCGIGPRLLRDSGARELLKILCGLFLTVTLLSPLPGLDVEGSIRRILPASFSGEELSREGEAMSKEAMAQIIKTELKSYILDKAAQLGARIQVRVELSGDDIPLPSSVTVEGTFTREQKEVLQKLLEEQLGITKEAQEWKWEP